MTAAISSNTQVILLLTAPLIARGGEASTDLLPLGLYKKLARQLRALSVQPADLLTSQAEPIIAACGEVIDGDRLRRLLGRGFLLSQVIEHWRARAIWVISRADPEYPRRLKQRLREDAPPLLYGCGTVARLDDGGLAVVGSRHVDDGLVAYAEAVGALAARSGFPIVSGGAKGIDQAAMRGAAGAGGQVIGVLADSLEKQALLRDHRAPLMAGRLLLISPYDPGARFNVGHAMQRNKLIYALADAALVVSSDLGTGGTWAGATEQLDRLHFVPVYVREGDGSAGLDALRRQGGIAWPEPQDADAFAEILRGETAAELPGAQVAVAEADAPQQRIVAAVDPAPDDEPPAARLWNAVRIVVSALLTKPHGEAAVADALDVSKPQARAWLVRLVAEGSVHKDKANRYVVAREALFDFPVDAATAPPPGEASSDG